MRRILYCLTGMFLFTTACTKDEPDLVKPGQNGEPLLLINEIHPTAYPQWIELYNPGETAVGLKGKKLFPGGDKSIDFNSETVIPAHSYYMVYLSGSLPSSHPSFHLPEKGGMVRLADEMGADIDKVVYPALPESQSYGRLSDGSADWAVFLFPSQSSGNDPALNRSPNIYRVGTDAISPLAGEPIFIHAQATDDHFIYGIWLHYSAQGKDSVVHMYPYSCGTGFRGEIPPQAPGTEVEFYIAANDNDSVFNFYPSTAPVEKIRFQLGR